MFVIDDLLLLWARGVLWVSREIEEAAAQETLREEGAVRRELGELYAALERKEVTEEMFAAREEELLARLEGGEVLTREAGAPSAEAQADGVA